MAVYNVLFSFMPISGFDHGFKVMDFENAHKHLYNTFGHNSIGFNTVKR